MTKKKGRFTLIEFLISISILVLFLGASYQIFNFIMRTAAYNSFVEQVTLNENFFIRTFLEITAYGSLPARITFPANAADQFKIDEKRTYCCYLRVSDASPQSPGPLLDFYQCRTEKANYPDGLPVKNEGLEVTRHWLMLNKDKKIVHRVRRLAYNSFGALVGAAPNPQNTTLKDYDTFDHQRDILENVDLVRFTIKPTDIDGTLTPNDRLDDQPAEQKISILVSQPINQRFNRTNLGAPGTGKTIEFSFIPAVPVQRLPF